MKILTANIAMGVPNARSAWVSLRFLVAFHTWKVIPFLLLRGHTLGLFNYTSTATNKKRLKFFSNHTTLDNTFTLIEKCQPDILILNEVILQLHRSILDQELQKMGFAHIAWGISLHYPDITVATVVASKLPCAESFVPRILHLPEISGGAGAAGVRLRDIPLTIVGCHLSVGLRDFSRRQMQDLSEIVESEREKGRQTICAGDFNETADTLLSASPFKAAGLKSVSRAPTCPLSLPRFLRKDLDHVFVPQSWTVKSTQTIEFGSDHLALLAEIE
jgi:endonuclease/exonuclease/phosphatase family metal-dependent hydrolase